MIKSISELFFFFLPCLLVHLLPTGTEASMQDMVHLCMLLELQQNPAWAQDVQQKKKQAKVALSTWKHQWGVQVKQDTYRQAQLWAQVSKSMMQPHKQRKPLHRPLKSS